MKGRTHLAGSRLALIWLLIILLLAVAPVALAQDKTLYWQRYDVDIAVMQSGDFRVTETQELVFTSGTFRFGQREILVNRFSDIRDITVSEEGGPEYQYSESDAPYTYRYYQDGSYVKVRYNFPPSTDTRRTIVIDYTIVGGLRYYPDDGVDQLFWKAIPSGNPFPTQSSTITVRAPEGATFTNYGIYGAEGQATFESGQSVASIVIDGRVAAGQEVEVVAEWPHGIVAGAPQPWQAELDQAAAEQAEREAFRSQWGPVFDLGFLALAGLLAIGGPVLLYLWWYRKGRDVPVGLIADYLPDPPSDLPAGMVGTLIDERADLQDVIATLLDLARRGVLEIEETQEPGFLGIGTKTDFTYRLKSQDVELRPYETLFIKEFFGRKTEVELSDLQNKFYSALPALRTALYKEVVDEKFFTGNPDTVRSQYGCLGMVVLAAAFGGGLFLSAVLSELSQFAFCLPISLGITGVGAVLVARYMPKRTATGAEAFARWNAFKRYLQNIEKYTNVEEASAIFGEYLPYAVAFGLEKSWIEKFRKVDAPPPTWWIPWGYPRPYYGGGSYTSGGPTGAGIPTSMPGGGGFPSEGGGSRPTLSDMSRGMGQSLAGMSAGLGTMLSQASRTLTSAPSQSGKGWSGGGGGGGFSGGGFSAAADFPAAAVAAAEAASDNGDALLCVLRLRTARLRSGCSRQD